MRLHGVPLRQVTAVWLLLAAASLLGSEACAAEDASPWDGDARSAVRLIAGTRMPGSGASLRAGIEIKLKPGWHTYWRYPGDAGVPPHFDFSGSQNLNTIEVLWPAPRRLEEAGLSTIGYDHDLILPLRLTPRDLHQPIALRLKLAYAICEKLCVPAESSVALGLAGGESTQEPRLAAAEAQVPHKATLGLVSAPLSISKISREGDTDHPRMLIDVAVSTGKQVDLFAEGPCRCRFRSPAHRAVNSASRSSSTARHPARPLRALSSTSPPSAATMRSRSPSISTNPPGALI